MDRSGLSKTSPIVENMVGCVRIFIFVFIVQSCTYLLAIRQSYATVSTAFTSIYFRLLLTDQIIKLLPVVIILTCIVLLCDTVQTDEPPTSPDETAINVPPHMPFFVM